MTAELEDSTALCGQGPHLACSWCKYNCVVCRLPDKSQHGGDRIRTGEANPGLLILLFPYPLKGDGYRALGEGTAVGEWRNWAALKLGLRSACF